MGVSPKEFKEFMNLDEKERWSFLFTTLSNHISSLKEVKWTTRMVLAGIIGVALKVVFYP